MSGAAGVENEQSPRAGHLSVEIMARAEGRQGSCAWGGEASDVRPRTRVRGSDAGRRVETAWGSEPPTPVGGANVSGIRRGEAVDTSGALLEERWRAGRGGMADGDTIVQRKRMCMVTREGHTRLRHRTPGADGRAAAAARMGTRDRRGVVLILVVAILGILFVVGVALLNTVTFSTKTIDAERVDRENRSALTAVESVVDDVLADGFVGKDGIPYSIPDIETARLDDIRSNGSVFAIQQDPTKREWDVRLPAYGEIPGVHTWIDLSEPVEEEDPTVSNPTCEVPLYSNLKFAMERKASADPRTVQMVDDDGDGLPNFYDPDARLQDLRLDALTSRPDNLRIMDADGDGIPDSYAMKLGPEMLSPDLHRALADRLRDPNYDLGNPGRDPDALYVSLKIVPHGAMVNLNTRLPVVPGQTDYPDVLLGSLLGYQPVMYSTLAGRLQSRYLPQPEEWALRNRGSLVVPRSRPLTHLVYDLTEELLLPHTILSGTPDPAQLRDSGNLQWWLYDPASLGDYSASKWRQLLHATSGIGYYDLNHTLTTQSHDDNLIRSGYGVDPATGAGPEMDWVEQMKAHNFEWVNYPDYLPPGDPRKGHLKFSFAYFGTNRPGAMPSPAGWLPPGQTLGVLEGASIPVDPNDAYQKLVRTVQDTFILMLRNYAGLVDFNGDGRIDPPGAPLVTGMTYGDNMIISLTAASLKANLLDFADGPGGGPRVLNEVTVRDWRTGLPYPNPTNPMKVFGLERQPYITEVYVKEVLAAGGPQGGTRLDSKKTVFAIELYNPYDTPMDMTGYEITDLNLNDGDVPAFMNDTGQKLDRFKNASLNGNTIPANGFAVFTGYSKTTTGVPDATNVQPDALIGPKSVIALVRQVGWTTPQPVVVDEVDMQSPDITDPAGNQVTAPIVPDTTVPATGAEISIQRDTTGADPSLGSLPMWRFPVPKYTYFKDDPKKPTVGKSNENNKETIQRQIRSVHIDFADQAGLRDAFPTVGTMLLLMRHANLFDPTQPAGKQYVPFNHVGPTGAGSLMALESDQIDNGRMPVFDTAGEYRGALPSNDVGAQQGIEALPWGQLIYDYFTALPLQYEDPTSAPTPDEYLKRQGQPPVDMDGMRVSGRIDINAAPWAVMAGLPYVPIDSLKLPDAMKLKIVRALYADHTATPPTRYWQNDPILPPGSRQPSEIGRELAQAIVAYRDARKIPTQDKLLANYKADDFTPYRSPLPNGIAPRFRRGYGFVTVGELLNVRPVPDPPLTVPGPGLWAYSIDDQAVATGAWFEANGWPGTGTAPGYITAVSRMVALSEWVTTKSHVFTVYGTIRGQYADVGNDGNLSSVTSEADAEKASQREVDQRAIYFQTTVDRLPAVFPGGRPERVGSRYIGAYSDVRSR